MSNTIPEMPEQLDKMMNNLVKELLDRKKNSVPISKVIETLQSYIDDGHVYPTTPVMIRSYDGKILPIGGLSVCDHKETKERCVFIADSIGAFLDDLRDPDLTERI